MSGFGPEELLECYRRGIFPMADNREAHGFYLMDPEHRAIFPIEDFRPSRSMRKFARNTVLKVTRNAAFPQVIAACAELRPETWISHGIEWLYGQLHAQGDAHSVEVYDGDELVGGLYGVTQGGAFFGESMFSTRTNASKLALMHLVAHLREKGFTLLDAQYLTPHLSSLGAVEITREDYQSRLKDALQVDARF
ncbi:MAG: leucyl/phenylalanyl-tRNA--protein transferase [Litorimonas sp.]